MYEKYTDGVKEALLLSYQIASRQGCSVLEDSHLLSAFVQAPKARLDVYIPDISIAMRGAICRGLTPSSTVEVSHAFRRGSTLAHHQEVKVTGSTPEVKGIIGHARTISEMLGHIPHIGTGHFLHGFLQNPESVPARVLSAFGLTLASIHEKIAMPLTSEMRIIRSKPDEQRYG